MRASWLLAACAMAVLSVVAMAGCASRDTPGRDQGRAQGSPAMPQAASTPSGVPAAAHGSGVLYGQVLRPPGLDPRSGAHLPPGQPASVPGTPVPVGGDEVEVRNEQGRTIATAVSRWPGDKTNAWPGGSFTISLPPGDYRVVEGICGISQHFTVASGAATHVTLMIKPGC